MQKKLIVQIREEIYGSLVFCRLLPEEQKGFYRLTSGTVDLHYINQHIVKESKTNQKHVAVAWINNKKAYDMVRHNWVIVVDQ